MRIGIIDLGTNSVRFDVHRVGRKRSKVLHREKLMVRLGQGAFLNRKLDRTAVARTLHAFVRFSHVAARLKVDRMIAYGTSALREVTDREKFIEQVRERSGIELRTISGEEEARFIALGILSNEKLPKGKFALVDIGGGSMEVSICRGKTVLRSTSFPLGTARLQQIFLGKSPPDAKSLEGMRVFIRNTLLQETLASDWPKVGRVIGSSGTIRALGKILGLNAAGTAIERSRLKSLNEAMAKMTTTELLALPRMETKRVDMILAGTVLFEETLGVLGAKKAVASEYSLRDGLIEEELKLVKRDQISHLDLHLAELRLKAAAFGAEPQHLARVEKLAVTLFGKLKPVHKLGPEWLPYLQAAVILRDVGEFVSLAQHGKHSSYIVRNSDIASLEKWEVEMIAELCHHHEDGKLDLDGLPFPKNRARRGTFLRLLALLRVVDALDSGPATKLALRSVEIARRQVRLRIAGQGLTGMEAFSVETQRPLFREVFGREIEAVKAPASGTRAAPARR